MKVKSAVGIYAGLARFHKEDKLSFNNALAFNQV